MFEQIYSKPSTVRRHEDAPYAEERWCYLAHCRRQGYTRSTVLFKARELLWVARKLSAYPSLDVTREQIEAVADDWRDRERCFGKPLNKHWTHVRFIEVARAWLRFLGYLQVPPEPTPFSERLTDFVTWMEQERGLAASTIECRTAYIRQFLRWYGTRERRSLCDVQLADVDAFLADGHDRGWCRVSTKNMAQVLRAFFRYGATQGWCASTLPESIRGPRIFKCAGLPTGPSWSDIQRLFNAMDTDNPRDLRDRAIVMLFAIYGLRASEVAELRLEDVDWEHDILHVSRAKRGSRQPYPLLPSVGNAIARYLRSVRSRTPYRQVFLTLLPPIRPVTPEVLYGLTARWLTALEIHAPHRGPHALRHACATRLVSEGLSLKAIGDHLGHRSPSATSIYAKVDLPMLREVAAFDLGGLT